MVDPVVTQGRGRSYQGAFGRGESRFLTRCFGVISNTRRECRLVCVIETSWRRVALICYDVSLTCVGHIRWHAKKNVVRMLSVALCEGSLDPNLEPSDWSSVRGI